MSDNRGEGNLRIVPVGDLSWEVEIVQGKEEPFIQGWYSADYGKKVPNPTAVFTKTVETATTFAWILLPAKGKVPDVKAKLIAQDEHGILVRVSIENQEPITVTVPLTSGTPKVQHK